MGGRHHPFVGKKGGVVTRPVQCYDKQKGSVAVV
jgi:hypothetical protein